MRCVKFLACMLSESWIMQILIHCPIRCFYWISVSIYNDVILLPEKSVIIITIIRVIREICDNPRFRQDTLAQTFTKNFTHFYV